MKATAWVAALVLAGPSAGCAVPALHGIPEGRRIELADGLLGTWQDVGEDERWTLEVERRSSGAVEVLVRAEEPHREPLETRLAVSAIELGGRLILDVALAESEFEELIERYGTLVIPAHVFCRAELRDQGLTLTFLDPDWLEGRGPVGRVELYDRMPLVTAEDGALIELLTAAAGDESAWKDAWALTRGS